MKAQIVTKQQPKTQHEKRKTKNDEPLVSVCIGVYNREKYIRECLDSVFAQTYRNLEVIVVDDASTDRTVEVIQSYGDRVRLIQREVNSGLPAVPRNQGIRLARGEYIAFLDSDDRWLPDKTKRQVDFLESNPHVMLVHAYCRLINADGGEGGIRHEGVIPATGHVFKNMLRHFTIATSAMMMRGHWFTKHEGFREKRCLKVGEDFEMCLRVARDYPIGFIPEVLAHYRRAPTGISQQVSAWRSYPRDIPAIFLVYRRPILWEGHVSAVEIRKIIQDHSLENAAYWREQRYPLRALWAIMQGLRVGFINGRLWLEATKTLGRAIWPKSRGRARGKRLERGM